MIKSGQQRHDTQRGFVLVLVVVGLVVGIGALLLVGLSRTSSNLSRDELTQNSLRQAKAGLLAYAASWPNRRGTNLATASNDVFGQKRPPGFLPCPDQTNSGAGVGGCGNETGNSAAGQAARLGRLPFRTLALPDLRDGYGERLWYAVSSKYKTNDPNYDLNPDTGLGTITVRNSQGDVIHDGTNTNLYNADAGGVAAVIIAPGEPLERWGDVAGTSRVLQDRGCGTTGCDTNGICNSPSDSVPRCIAVNYLEKAWGLGSNEDNADFMDRNDSRAGNTNGFIAGPVVRGDGSIAVNDSIVVITYSEIMQVIMHKVALEVSHCLVKYAELNSNRYPYPAPVCRSGYSVGLQWSDKNEFLFGRVPDPVFDTTNADTGGAMSQNWNTVATNTLGCTIDLSSAETATRWWTAWKDHVFMAVAYDHRPGVGVPSNPCTTAHGCLQIVDTSNSVIAANKQFAVIVSGRPISPQIRSGGSPVAQRVTSHYLESRNAALDRLNDHSATAECSDMSFAPRCTSPSFPECLASNNRVELSRPTSTFNDVVVYHPK